MHTRAAMHHSTHSAPTFESCRLPLLSLSSPGRHSADSIAAQVIILIAEIFVGLATLRQGFSLLRRLDAAPTALTKAKAPATSPDVEMTALVGGSLDGTLPESTPPEVGPPEDSTVAVSSRWATPPRVRDQSRVVHKTLPNLTAADPPSTSATAETCKGSDMLLLHGRVPQ